MFSCAWCIFIYFMHDNKIWFSNKYVAHNISKIGRMSSANYSNVLWKALCGMFELKIICWICNVERFSICCTKSLMFWAQCLSAREMLQLICTTYKTFVNISEDDHNHCNCCHRGRVGHIVHCKLVLVDGMDVFVMYCNCKCVCDNV